MAIFARKMLLEHYHLLSLTCQLKSRQVSKGEAEPALGDEEIRKKLLMIADKESELALERLMGGIDNNTPTYAGDPNMILLVRKFRATNIPPRRVVDPKTLFLRPGIRLPSEPSSVNRPMFRVWKSRTARSKEADI